jgi:hypothetical protein
VLCQCQNLLKQIVAIIALVFVSRHIASASRTDSGMNSIAIQAPWLGKHDAHGLIRCEAHELLTTPIAAHK